MKNTVYKRTFVVLLLILCLCALAALSIGRLSMNPLDVYRVIRERLQYGAASNEAMEVALFKIRLPRVVAAMMIGAMLSLSGAVYQGVFKNPLVSPDILGVASGASVGAAGAILLGLGLLGRQVLAFCSGIAAVVLTTAIPRLLRNHSNLILVLSGIIVSGFLSSLLAIMKFVAEEQTELAAIVFWQMGSFAEINMTEIIAISPAFIAGTAILISLSWRINILSFGEAEAKSLGMDIGKMRGIVIACASLLTASAVCISGTIGWIGLVIPHLARLLVGSDHVRMMPITVLAGALFMLIIDTIARALLTVEIPLSILTGLLGAPCYAWLLYKQRTSVS
ncbi:MAG: iron ABC transporter permease [bacterium]|jgi:iron complex transport system permease protein|nr:iron ABC transporter permease [Bacillota bacterium]HHW54725.1 iron ABC transporter permease [Bacillota bacterium]